MRPYTKEDIISIYEQIKSLAKKSAQKRKWLKSLKYIETATRWAYEFNFIYRDDTLESLLKRIAEENIELRKIEKPNPSRCALLDTWCISNRGLTQQYLRAMIANNIEILYISLAPTLTDGQDIVNELKLYDKATAIYYEHSVLNAIEKANEISKIITDYAPEHVFLHIAPWETTLLMACHSITDTYICNINLTDHAFWMGSSFINYNLEFRPYGETVSIEKRGLTDSKLIRLPYYPVTPLSGDFEGLPELSASSVIVLTGGALYKMLGKNDAFFKMMDAILDLSPSVYMFIAGFNSERLFDIRQKTMKHKDRVIKIGRRNDIDFLFDKIDIYLNTYPTAGALMVQYAAKHGKPILSYCDKDDPECRVEELLNHYQDEFRSYTDMNEFLGYAERLILDKDCRKLEGRKLQNGLMTPEKFAEEFKKALNTHKSSWGVGHDEISYDKFYERYIDLENNNGFSASKNIVKMLRSDFIQIKGHRWKFFRILSELAVDKVKRMV